MRALLDSAEGRAAVLGAAPDLPDDVGRWLARLCLLHDLPFNALVPDARMLPAESVRFFVIDQNWLDSLVDGALSVAAVAAVEAALVALHRPGLQAAGRGRAAASAGSLAPPVWTGLLLRSAAVAGWPGLSVIGYPDAGPASRPGAGPASRPGAGPASRSGAGPASRSGAGPAAAPDGAEPLPLLRIDRPAPSVLIAIFDGFVRRVEIAEPARGLHFGVRPSAGQPPRVAVRFIGGGKQFPPGVQPPGEPSVEAGFRDAARGVLDIGGLAGRLDAKLREVYSPVTPPQLRSAAFGIEMVAAPARRFFVAGHAR